MAGIQVEPAAKVNIMDYNQPLDANSNNFTSPLPPSAPPTIG